MMKTVLMLLLLKEVKEVKRARLTEYAAARPSQLSIMRRRTANMAYGQLSVI